MNMNEYRKRLITIDCPVCGHQYLPAEIYIPKRFFGNPSYIERTNTGKIDIFDGTSMDLQEEYICDKCLNKFKVVANVSFKTQEVNSKKSFDKVYTSPIHTKKISLFEG